MYTRVVSLVPNKKILLEQNCFLLAPTVFPVGNKLQLFEEDGSLISKQEEIFVNVPKALLQKSVAQKLPADSFIIR